MSPRYRRLGFEALETRTMLAGDVLAAVVEGDLVLTGDAGDNVILIRPGDVEGEILLIGVLGTTINGDPRSATAIGVTDDILASLGGGNDRFVMTRFTAPSGVQLELGAGNNRVKLDRLEAPGNVTIEGGVDQDGILLRGVELGGELTIELGDGENHLTIMNSSFDGAVEVTGGAHRDRVETIRAAFDETFDVDLLASNDRLISVRSQFTQNAAIQMGSGTDHLMLLLAVAEAEFNIDGSTGVDVFVNSSNLFDNPPSIVNFETVT